MSSNLRLLEEIARSQVPVHINPKKLESKLKDLEALLQRVISENKGLLDVVER